MPSYLIVLLTFAWLAILVGGWLGWQLLRQNGRLLLRLDDQAPKLAAVAAGFQPASEGGILPPGKPSRLGEATNNHDASALSDAGLEAPLTGRQGCPPLPLLILTTGDAEKNRQFFAEHKV